MEVLITRDPFLRVLIWTTRGFLVVYIGVQLFMEIARFVTPGSLSAQPKAARLKLQTLNLMPYELKSKLLKGSCLGDYNRGLL